jgi:hypothetical protein
VPFAFQYGALFVEVQPLAPLKSASRPRTPFLARRVNGSLLSVRDDTTKCTTTLDEEPRRTEIVSEWTMQELRNFGLHNGVNDGVSSLLSCEPSAEVNGAALSTT